MRRADPADEERPVDVERPHAITPSTRWGGALPEDVALVAMHRVEKGLDPQMERCAGAILVEVVHPEVRLFGRAENVGERAEDRRVLATPEAREIDREQVWDLRDEPSRPHLLRASAVGREREHRREITRLRVVDRERRDPHDGHSAAGELGGDPVLHSGIGVVGAREHDRHRPPLLDRSVDDAPPAEPAARMKLPLRAQPMLERGAVFGRRDLEQVAERVVQLPFEPGAIDEAKLGDHRGDPEALEGRPVAPQRRHRGVSAGGDDRARRGVRGPLDRDRRVGDRRHEQDVERLSCVVAQQVVDVREDELGREARVGQSPTRALLKQRRRGRRAEHDVIVGDAGGAKIVKEKRRAPVERHHARDPEDRSAAPSLRQRGSGEERTEETQRFFGEEVGRVRAASLSRSLEVGAALAGVPDHELDRRARLVLELDDAALAAELAPLASGLFIAAHLDPHPRRGVEADERGLE